MVDLLTRRAQLLCVNHSMVRLIGGDVASCERGEGEFWNPWLSLLAAASFCHQDIAPQTKRGEEGTQMQSHSARRACRNHMAAMTKAAKALQVLREAVLNEFCVWAALNDALHPNSSQTAKLSPDQIATYFNHFIWGNLIRIFFYVGHRWDDT